MRPWVRLADIFSRRLLYLDDARFVNSYPPWPPKVSWANVDVHLRRQRKATAPDWKGAAALAVLCRFTEPVCLRADVLPCSPQGGGLSMCQDVDECSSQPCKHGGTCIDSTSSPAGKVSTQRYECECVNGYTGTSPSAQTSQHHACVGAAWHDTHVSASQAQAASASPPRYSQTRAPQGVPNALTGRTTQKIVWTIIFIVCLVTFCNRSRPEISINRSHVLSSPFPQVYERAMPSRRPVLS